LLYVQINLHFFGLRVFACNLHVPQTPRSLISEVCLLIP
jgi:hypothetical protein